MAECEEQVDPEYPGTAMARLAGCVARAKSLTVAELSGDWEEARRRILWAGGLRDLPVAKPGQGYTGHSFNDANHCDLATMRMDVSANENDGSVAGIALGNRLGDGIKVASTDDPGPGGSWSTCTQGCNKEPPSDVAHIQFKSRIAFKLVWCPPQFTRFVLVDDAGKLLAGPAKPTGNVPDLSQRQMNFMLVQGSKYAIAASKIV